MYRGVPQQVIRCVKDFPPAHRSELMRRMLKEPY
jgi:hypothetical protein